jgi:hypothetical protein
MDEPTWDRLAAGTGLLFVALVIIAGLVAGAFPGLNDQPEAIARFFQDERSAVQLSTVLWAFGSLALLWFAGSVRHHLAMAEGGTARLAVVAFGFGVAAVSIIVVTLAVTSGLAYSIARRSDPTVTAAIFELRHMFQVFTPYFLAGFIGAASLAAWRSGALPQGLSGAGLVIAVLLLVSGLAPVFEGSSLAPGKIYGDLVFYAFLAWVVVASITMMQRLATPRAPM